MGCIMWVDIIALCAVWLLLATVPAGLLVARRRYGALAVLLLVLAVCTLGGVSWYLEAHPSLHQAYLAHTGDWCKRFR
jgi:hypothetical protein